MLITKNLPGKLVHSVFNVDSYHSRAVSQIMGYAPGVLRDMGERYIPSKIRILRQATEVNLKVITDAIIDVKQHGSHWAFDEVIRDKLRAVNIHELLESLANQDVEGLFEVIRPIINEEEIDGNELDLNTLVLKEAKELKYGLAPNQKGYLVPGGTSGVVRNFIPSLLNTLRVALTYFHEGNVPDMIWDCYLLLFIYSQLLGVPYYAIKVLSACVGLPAAIAIVTITMGLGTLALDRYVRQWRKHPSWLAHDARNVTELIKKEKWPKSCVGYEKTIDEIVASLTVGESVLVIGPSGSGKSTVLLGGAVREVLERNLGREVYDASGTPTGSSGNYKNGFIERLNELIKSLGHLSQNTVLVVDEILGPLLNSPGDLPKLRKLLDDTPVVIWGAATQEEYDKLLKLEGASDRNPAGLSRRFKPVYLKDDPLKLSPVVKKKIRETQGIIPCDADVYDYIEEKSREYSQDAVQPNAVCQLINDVFKRVLIVVQADCHKSQRLLQLTAEYSQAEKAEEVRDLHHQIKKEKADLKEFSEKVQHLRELYQKRAESARRVHALACRLLHDGENTALRKEFLYQYYYDFRIKDRLADDAEKQVYVMPESSSKAPLLDREFPVRVTQEVVDSVLREMKEPIEEPVPDDQIFPFM